MIYKNPMYFNQKKGKYGRTNTRVDNTLRCNQNDIVPS